MNRLRILFFVGLFVPAWADPQLEALRDTMVSMRKPAREGPRDATQQMSIAKHQLRDWVEPQLKNLPPGDDGSLLERRLNGQLRAAGLMCGADQQKCPEWTFSGFLEDLKFHWSRGFLILQTGLGIECGFDESAYVYSHSDEGWRRIWQTEQNTYTEKAYRPQTIHEVLISPYSRVNDYFVLTLGTESWCASSWHNVYYRAFRMGPDPNAAPLIAGAEWAYVGVEPPIQGSVSQTDALVQFMIRSIDGGVHSRPAIRHYRIDGQQAKRIDPLALRPRDFVDEWLTNDWRETVFWSESANRGAMRSMHGKLHKDFVSGEFIYPTMHCPTMPDLWQVGVDFSDPPTPIGAAPKGTYFLVRWQPPYRFRMVDVSEHPMEACTEADRRADDEPATLFPDRGRD